MTKLSKDKEESFCVFSPLPRQSTYYICCDAYNNIHCPQKRCWIALQLRVSRLCIYSQNDSSFLDHWAQQLIAS